MNLKTRKHRSAFTLVELLVVIGIITILIGILLPTLNRARVKARKVACAAQLKDIGNLFRIYLNDHKDRLPRVNTMPSIQPPIALDPITGLPYPSIYETIDTEFAKHKRPIGEPQGVSKGWHCSADLIATGIGQAGSPTQYDTYFDREGGSYVYDPFFNMTNVDFYSDGSSINKTFEQMLAWFKSRKRDVTEIPFLHDFESFHGKSTEVGSMNFLFADFHVGAWEPRSH